MSYQVIARKYRPQRFADVVGQEHVTQTLSNAITQNRIAHAYLFCGPRGTGKTTVARIFAKCLNCTGGPKVNFEDSDPRCQEITEGRSIDVLEIDGASNNGVEQVRELRETVKYAPASSRFKIYIIDEVHMLTPAAFNALLKTLEEPPEHVKFMFATTDPEKILPTILSRCQRFDLRRIPVSLITEHLRFIAAQEKVNIDAEALHAIARGADGGMRDAESALDQLISFCGENIAESDVLSMFGLTARSQVVALAEAIFEKDAARALGELNGLARHGKDLGRLLSDLLHHCRNLLIFQVSKGDLQMLEVSEVEAASLGEQAGRIQSEALTRIMEVLTDAEGRLRDASSKKIFIEVTLLKAIEARDAISIDEVLQRLQQLRPEGHSGSATPGPTTAPGQATQATHGTHATLPPPPPHASHTSLVSHPSLASLGSLASPPPPPAAPPAPAAAALTEEDLVNLWRDIIEAVGRASPFTKNYLIEAHPVSMAKNVLTIGFDPEFADHIDLVNNQKTHTLLQTKLSESGRPQMQIRFIKAERPAGYLAAMPRPESEADIPDIAADAARAAASAGPAPLEAASARPAAKAPITARTGKGTGPLPGQEFKEDPLIQKALDIFKGRIVEVRA